MLSHYHKNITTKELKHLDYEPRLYDGEGRIYDENGQDIHWYIDYRVWNWDKKAFECKQYTGMNKFKKLTERKKAATVALKELRQLIREGVTVGNLPEPTLPPDADAINLKTFTLRQAAVFFLNHKNTTILGNETHSFEATYNHKLARISEGTFKSYRGCLKKRFEWQEVTKQENLLLSQFRGGLVDHFFTFLVEAKGLEPKTINNYRGCLSTMYNYNLRGEHYLKSVKKCWVVAKSAPLRQL